MAATTHPYHSLSLCQGTTVPYSGFCLHLMPGSACRVQVPRVLSRSILFVLRMHPKL